MVTNNSTHLRQLLVKKTDTRAGLLLILCHFSFLKTPNDYCLWSRALQAALQESTQDNCVWLLLPCALTHLQMSFSLSFNPCIYCTNEWIIASPHSLEDKTQMLRVTSSRSDVISAGRSWAEVGPTQEVLCCLSAAGMKWWPSLGILNWFSIADNQIGGSRRVSSAGGQ